jgi:CheY-like chemotaxis protein
LRAFRPAAEKKGLSLDLSIDEGTPRYARGDSLRYGQVLMNLVSNAIKFTESGAVSVELSPEPSGEGASGDPRSLILRATVRDTGIGMSPESLPLLFEEFSQADASIGRRFGGTGLGLSICKRLVELFGGRIEVSSKAGEGSVFSYTARFEPATEARAGSLAAGAARSGGLLVLVVDDDPVNVAVARRYVGRSGCETLAAQTGAEALAIVEERRPDLVLMDLGLPDMDGFEACRRIHGADASRSGEETPVAAMTARADAETRAECASAGMRDCLAKPVDPLALERLLDRVAADRGDLGPRSAYRLRSEGASAGPGSPSAPPEEAASPAAPTIDEGALLARIHGDRAFARELLGILVSEAPEKEEAMRAALAAGDAASLQKLAHRLKGAALTLCAKPLAGAAARLESACAEAARSGRDPAAPDASSRLEAPFAELEARYAGAVAEASRYLGASV